jgi:hypothetical protein
MMDDILEKFPIMSVLALIFVAVGAYLTLTDTLTYTEYLTETMKVLIGLGVVGGVRVADKYRKDNSADL